GRGRGRAREGDQPADGRGGGRYVATLRSVHRGSARGRAGGSDEPGARSREKEPERASAKKAPAVFFDRGDGRRGGRGRLLHDLVGEGLTRRTALTGPRRRPPGCFARGRRR